MISTMTSAQEFRAIGNIIRISITELYVFRVRNLYDPQAFVGEVSALANQRSLLEIYNLATKEDFSFLYIRLDIKSKDDMLYIKFNQRTELED